MSQYQSIPESEIHFSMMEYLDNSQECLVGLDLNFRLDYFNKSIEKLTKKKLPDGLVLGLNFIDVLKLENHQLADAVTENLDKVLQEKSASEFELHYISDQGFRYYKIQIHPIIKSETVQGFICKIGYNSEDFLRLRLEKLLNDFKSTLFEATNEENLLWLICEDILSNLFLEDAIIFMKSQDQLISKAVFGSKLKGHRQMDRELYIELGKGIVGSVASSGTPEMVNNTSEDSRYIKEHFQAGSEIALPIISQENEVLGVINCESSSKNFFRKIHLEILNSVAEITAQKIGQIRKVDELRISKEYNKAVLNSTPNSYILFGRDKNVLSLNRTAKEDLPRFSGREVDLGSSYETLIHPKYKDEFSQLFDACLTGERCQIEKKISEPEEEDSWVRLIFSPATNDDNEIFGVALNMQNISAEKLAQSLILEKNESLELANKELDKVIYSVSHDLRAPVSNVIGLSSLIEYDTDIKEIKEYNSLIQSSMRRMDNFIKNVLAYSRNSKVEPHYELENVEDLFDGIIQDHSYMKEIGNIQFEMQLDCKNVITDHQRLSVILSNLISNAIKYHDSSKEKQWIKLSCYSDELNVIFKVEDNGLGIEEENLSKLFNMYYMVNAMERSSGIGLYILKDTLKLMHGNIEAQSKVGQGSCFRISLPKIFPEEITAKTD